MPNKTVSANLQSSLNEGSFSSVKDSVETNYKQQSENGKSRSQETNLDTVPSLNNQTISLPAYPIKDREGNVTKVTGEPVLVDRKKKQLTLENHLPDVFQFEETERRKNNTNESNALLKKRTHGSISQDHIDFSARSAFPLTSDAESIETSSGLSELSSTIVTHQISTTTSNKSKTGLDVGCQKQKFKLNTSLPSSKCLPSVDLSKINQKESEINISMPSSVYGTQSSNIESVLTGLNLNRKNMDNEFISEIEQQIVHLTGGSVNLLSTIQENPQTKNSSQLINNDKSNEKLTKLSEKIKDDSQVVNEDDYVISNKQDDFSESSKNSIIDYSSALSITVPHDNFKLSTSQKVSKPQTVVQHISKIIAQNAAIVETTNPIRPRQHVRHLSFSENFNEKEYRKSHLASKIRRYSEDLSSTFNNSSYQSNKSKLHNALLGHSDSPFLLKNSDIFPEHKKSSGMCYNLNGIYTILENEKLKFSLPLSSEEKEKNFLKPSLNKSHYTSLSSDKLSQLDTTFSNDFISKLEKHSKSEGSIIKDLLLKPKHVIQHSVSEESSTQQTNTEILTKQKTNEVHSTGYLCKFCGIGFHSKDNLEAHQSHYCKLRTRLGTNLGFSLKDVSLIEKIRACDSPEEVMSDKLNLREVGEIRNFITDSDGWIPPLKQRKLSEPILSKSHLEVPANRRKTIEFSKSEKTLSPHCIPSVSPGNWNSQMSGGKVQIFDEIGNKNATLKTNLHKSALFTLLDRKSRSSQSVIENESWTSESNKVQKFKKMSLPTVVVTISKPELNSGGTVMQVHTSNAVVGSPLCVQATSQTPLMATGVNDLNKWKHHFPSNDEKMELSPLSKNANTESEDEKLVPMSPHHNISSSLLNESSSMSPVSEFAELSSVESVSPSLSHCSDLSIIEKHEKVIKKIPHVENDNAAFTQLPITSVSVLNTDTITTTSLPPFYVSDSSTVSQGSSIKETNTTLSDNINTNRNSPNKTDSVSDTIKKKCPNPSRPTFLPLKKGITLVGSTLISPETPRPKKTSIQLYLGGHAYTSLGLKCSTRSTFCCIYRSQPMYVPQDTDPKLSMYSNWQVLPAKEELFGMTPSQLIGLYNSRQSKENGRMTISIAKMGNTFVCTHSSYWTFRMQDLAKEELQKSPKIKEKACDKDIIMEDASPSENSVSIEISVTYSSNVEIGLYFPREQIRLDENSSHSMKDHNHSEDTTEENTSHSNIHSPDEMIQSHPSKRVRHSEGNSNSNDDGTYVRGRGWGKYICEECGIRCKKPSVLKKHIRTHTNLRPYKCYHCAFAFKTKGNLTKHMKSKAHFKKCIELGIVPVPTTVDDSQIDEEALDKQEKLDKDICPSLNSQEFEDGEDIDDDCDDTEHSENDDEDEENSELSRTERFHDANNLRIGERININSEKEFMTGRDMTEKEGEAAQSLLHLSTCNVSQASHKLISTKSHSVTSTIDQGDKSKSLLGVFIPETSLPHKISHGTEEYEDLIQNQFSSKTVISSTASSKSQNIKVPGRTEFSVSDVANISDKIYTENKKTENRCNNFENISSSSPNADFREKLITMWTTSPQSWHTHALPFYQNAHINYNSAGMAWESQFSDANVSKPTNLVGDLDQPIDLRVCKTKDRLSEEIYKSDLYEDWRISQNMLNATLRPEQKKVIETINPKIDMLNHHKLETSPLKFIHDINKSCLQTNMLNQQTDEENNTFIETTVKQKCQDSKSHTKAANCHENSIPSYNVGRSENSFESITNNQPNQSQFENPPVMMTEESVDSDSVQCHSNTSVTPPIIEDNELHMPIISQENSLITVPHNILRIENSTQQRECTNKSGTGSNSYVTEGKCTCAICNKTFTKPSQLRLHVNIHYFERPFRCDDCAISFRTNGHLEKHKRSASHYNKMHTNTSFGTPCADNPRPFKCTDCNIAFRMHGHLAKHLRSKMHIMKLECLSKLPFGMYAEMERTGVNFNDIDTTDCETSLESLQKIAQTLYTPQNAQQSLDLSATSLQTIKPKAHIMNSSYSSATSFQVINSGSVSFNNNSVGIQQSGQVLNLSSLDITNNDKLTKPNNSKNYLLANEQIIRECMTSQKEFRGEKLHSNIISPVSLHSRTCPCDNCISLRFSSSNTSSGESCFSRPVKKEQWKLKDRLIAEFQEESTHAETPR